MQKKLRMILILILIIPGLLLGVACQQQSPPPIDTTPIDTTPPGDTEVKEAAKIEAQKAEEERLRKAEEERLRQAEAERLERERQAKLAARAQFEQEDVYFEFDSSVLNSNAQAALRDKAEYLRDNPDVSVTIEGHCDERGSNEYNLALGDRRAESTKTFMVDLGIPVSRISTISYGEEKPVDSGHNEDAWTKNRRAHFSID